MSFDEQFQNSGAPPRRGSARANVDMGGGMSSPSSSTSAIKANIARMGDNISRMARMVQQLGTAKDTEDLRHSLRNMRKETTNLSRQTKDSIQLLGSSGYQNSDWRIQQEKLRKDFEIQLKRLQDINSRAIEMEKAFVAKAKAGGRRDDYGSSEYVPKMPSQERQSLMHDHEERQHIVRMDNMIQFNENLIAERDEDVKQIEKDVLEINEIFRDLSVMVQDQGTKINQIHDYIETTTDNTGAAEQEIGQAYASQKKARRRTCLLAAILFAAVVIVVLIVTQTVNTH